MLYNEEEKPGQIFIDVVMITLKGVITGREFRVTEEKLWCRWIWF